jgi:hypothetical protein
MKLPNADRAVVDIRKLRDYCLNPTSPRGRTKARVFESVLGLRRADAEGLRNLLLRAAIDQECDVGEKDEYGQRYTLDFLLETNAGKAWVRSGWIVGEDDDVPRLTTCYVLVRRRIL